MGGYTYAAGFGSNDAQFMLPLFDSESGEPVAVLDGASMNPYKTGATGAVGVDALARDTVADLAVIGSGTQARGQVLSTTCVRSFDRVQVYSPTASNRETFATEMNEQVDAAVTAVESASDAVSGADVVITATTASEPVFDGDDLDDGTHVTAMGQYHPKKRELDTTTIERATYVPDLRARVTQDAGSVLHAMNEGVVDMDHIHAELGEVLVGDAPGRRSQSEITVFDSGGTAIETVAAGKLLYDRAVANDIGEEIKFAAASEAMRP
jgi:alanine dehydrogenase